MKSNNLNGPRQHLYKIAKFLSLYTAKFKLWEGTDMLKLLSKDQAIRKMGKSIDSLFTWPYNEETKGYYKRHKELRMPFHFIPSCSRFKAEIKPLDWLFALFGMSVRTKGSSLRIRNWRNGGANRYLFSMFLQLASQRDQGNGKKYWRLAWVLMNSHAYQVSAFNYVHHNWHRNMPISEVNRIMEGVKTLVENRSTEIDFKRVYIPKANGKLRPLGVPSLSWRVYLHMLNNIIVWYRTGQEGNQHAYITGRGVHTAWESILERIDSPNIYEFDLKGFFDNVDQAYLSRVLEEMGFPPEAIYFLQDLGKSTPKLPEEKKLDETPTLSKEALNKVLATGEVTEDFWKLESVRTFLELNYSTWEDRVWDKTRIHEDGSTFSASKVGFDPETEDLEFGDILIQEKLAEEGFRPDAIERGELCHMASGKLVPLSKGLVIAKIIEEQWAILDSLAPFHPTTPSNVSSTGLGEYFKGLPQGAATSCGLSTLCVRHLTDTSLLSAELKVDGVEVVMYADDGLIFLEDPAHLELVLKLFEKAGVEVEKSKSGWVKLNNEWQNDLKFCGIRYDGANCTIEASTRNGSTLKFDVVKQFLAYLLERREELLLKGSASHLNDRSNYRGQTVKSWILSELVQFTTFQRREMLLFRGKWSGYFLSSLYCDSWNLREPSETELTSESASSWVKQVWPRYRWEQLRRLRRPLLESELRLKFDDLVSTGYVPAPGFKWHHLLDDYVPAPGFREWIRWSKRLGKALSSLARVQEAYWFFVGGLYDRYLVDISKAPELQKYTWNEILIERIFETMGSCLQIDIYNSSSYACDSLLTRFPEDFTPNSGLRIRFVSRESTPQNRWLKAEAREKILPALRAALEKKLRKEFRKNFGVDPIK